VFVGFVTVAGLVNQLIEAREEKRLLRLQGALARRQLLIIDDGRQLPPQAVQGARVHITSHTRRAEPLHHAADSVTFGGEACIASDLPQGRLRQHRYNRSIHSSMQNAVGDTL